MSLEVTENNRGPQYIIVATSDTTKKYGKVLVNLAADLSDDHSMSPQWSTSRSRAALFTREHAEGMLEYIRKHHRITDAGMRRVLMNDEGVITEFEDTAKTRVLSKTDATTWSRDDVVEFLTSKSSYCINAQRWLARAQGANLQVMWNNCNEAEAMANWIYLYHGSNKYREFLNNYKIRNALATPVEVFRFYVPNPLVLPTS